MDNEPYDEMTDEQLERQDFVDNAVFSLIQEVNPTNKPIDWDIEMIGKVRDVVVGELEKKLGISEFDIYP
jgi:hypothetical protein